MVREVCLIMSDKIIVYDEAFSELISRESLRRMNKAILEVLKNDEEEMRIFVMLPLPKVLLILGGKLL